MHTLEELKERMVDTLDEITILELLEINSSELVEMFVEKVDDKFEYLIKEVFDDDETPGED